MLQIKARDKPGMRRTQVRRSDGRGAQRCSVSRKKSNVELREIGKNTPFSLNAHHDLEAC
jgi:hypothetical protein